MARDNVDERVVQLMLDSKEFDSNAKKSIQSLDDLKKALEFEGSSKGFEAIERAARKVDFSIMDDGIQKVQNHFNLLNTVATTVIERITNSAIDSGTRLVKALSVDQISQGWSQFEERTTAMQRIMSATTQQFANEEEQIAAVNEQMEKLVWFTDETSYKYLDIVNSIGKFTANNVDLKQSVKAMEGISTWASLSGASIEESGRAMYNLAQAISVGAVKLQDWKSIENANMATYEFKQTAIETAVALGTLKREANGLYNALGAEFKEGELFTEGLKKGWFSTDVLMETLSRYGGFTDLLNEFMNAVEKEGFYTTAALGIIDDYVDGHLDLEDAMYRTGMSAEELTGWLEKLGSEEMELGRKGFKAAQETKTLSEAIDYIKTAVSSGWAQSFQYIFGDYNEAKEWWSEVSEALYSVFVESGEARNELLAFWKEMGGREVFLDGIRTLAKNIKGILDSISGAWENIFGKDFDEQVQDLLNLTERFKAFAEAITFTDSTFQDFLRILESIFRTLKTIGRVVGTVMRALEPFGRVLNKLAGYVLNLVANFAEMASINLEMFFNDQKLQAMYDILSFIVTLIAYLTSGALKTLFIGFQNIVDIIAQLMTSFNSSIGGVDNVVAALIAHVREIWIAFLDGDTIIDKIGVIINAFLGAVIGGVTLVINTIRKLFKGELIDLDEVYGNVAPYFEKLADFLKNSNLPEIFETIGGVIGVAVGYIRELFVELGTADSAIRQLIGSIQGELASLYGWFKNLFADLSAGDIAAIAFVISLSLVILELKKLVTATTAVTKSFSGLVGTFNSILKTNFLSSGSNFMEQLNGIFNKTKILQIGLSAVMLVAALNEFNKLDVERTMQSIIMIGATMGLLLGAMKMLAKIQESMPKKEKTGENKIALYILEISAGIFLISKALSTLTAALDGEDAVSKMTAAVTTLGLLGTAMVAMVKVLSEMNTKDLAGAATSMVGMSVALSLLVTPVKVIAGMEWDKALQGCLGVIGMLVAMGMAARLMQEVDWKNLIALGVTMPLISGAMLVLSAAVYAMSMALTTENAWGAIGVIAGGIVVFAAALSMLAGSASVVSAPSLLAMSAAIISFGLAITFMATGLVMLSELEWQKVVGYLGVFTGAIMLLLATATLCTAATLPLLALAAVIVSFGAAVALFATGIRALVEAFALMATTVTSLGVISEQLGIDLPEAIQKGLDAVYQIISGLLQMIPELIPDVIVAVASLIGAVIAALAMNIPAVVSAVMLVGLAICKTIVALGPPFAEALIAAIKVLNTYVPEILEQLGIFVELLFEGIGVILRHACIGLVDMVVAALFGKDTMNKFKEGQLEATDYMADGLEEGGDKVVKTANELGDKVADAYQSGEWKRLDINSPSGQEILTMLYAALGLEEGAEKYAIPTADTVGTAIGDTLVDSTRVTAVSGMANVGEDLAKMKKQMLEKMGLNDVPGLFTLSSSSKGGKDIYAGLTDYERGVAMAEHWTEAEVQQLLASKKKAKKEAEEEGYDFGYDVGESFGSGASAGGKAGATKEKEKTAEEIVNEYISAIESAYSRGVEQLDLSTQRLNLQDKMWNLTHKEGTTDAEKKAYEAAKKEHELDMLDKQMESQLWKINLKQAEYEDKLNTLGSSAVQTQKAYNELLEEQYNILDLYSQKQELMTEESDESADAFIAASKEISSYRELVEKGLITEEMMVSAANEKLKAFRHEESDLARKHTTELDNMLGQVIAAFEENGGNLKEAFGTIVTENMIEAFDNVGDNTEGMAASLTDTFANMITVAKDDPKLIAEQKGLGADIVNGTISGMDETKDKFIKNAKVISHDGLDAMADVFDVNSPSKETYKMGVWLDEGLANGLLNDGAVTKVLNAADEIARKLLARLKAKLGVSSPSKETYAIAKWLDVGMANGLGDYANVVMKSSDKMVSNLLSNMKSQIDQNGSEMRTYLKDSFGLNDDDLRFTVIVDADTSLADSSLTELERAYAYQTMALNAQTPISQQSFSSVNGGNNLLAKLNEQEAYRATQLQNLYDLVNSYVTEQKSKNFSGENSGDADSAKTIVNNFNQTNISPKPISALDTYRNTQKQLNTFSNKFSKR